jgi:cytidylate kinase
MNPLEKMKSFLDASQYEEARCSCLDFAKGRNPFVTVSREAGAGGHSLAVAILKEVGKEHSPLYGGWQICDQEICRMIAEEPGLKVYTESLLAREYHSGVEDFLKELLEGDSPQDAVIHRMFGIIRKFAVLGKVVFVGRGAVCLTRDLPLGVHIRLVASLESRIGRMAEYLRVTEKRAREITLEQDQARARLVKTYFDKDIEDPLLYDAIWNTDRAPVDEIAKFTVGMVKRKACHCGETVPG